MSKKVYWNNDDYIKTENIDGKRYNLYNGTLDKSENSFTSCSISFTCLLIVFTLSLKDFLLSSSNSSVYFSQDIRWVITRMLKGGSVLLALRMLCQC